jgi:uncharacterized membrane protein (DUF485 family)
MTGSRAIYKAKIAIPTLKKASISSLGSWSKPNEHLRFDLVASAVSDTMLWHGSTMSNAAKNESAPTVNDKDWNAIANSKAFQDLIAIKKTFIVPALVIFLLYYLALAVLVGYAPKLASTRVIGTVTIAYLFALSQFAAGWLIAALYLVAAAKFDALTVDILAHAGEPQEGE